MLVEEALAISLYRDTLVFADNVDNVHRQILQNTILVKCIHYIQQDIE